MFIWEYFIFTKEQQKHGNYKKDEHENSNKNIKSMKS